MKKPVGSLTVEASIVVPIVFVVILPFLFLLRSVYVYDSVQSAVLETTRLMEPLLYLPEKLPEEGESAADISDHEKETADEAVESVDSLITTLESATGETGIESLIQNLALQQVVRFFLNRLLAEKNLGSRGLVDGTDGISYLLSDFELQDAEIENLFRIAVVYQREFPFARRFASLDPVYIQAVGRRFVGQKTQGRSDEDADETEEESKIYYRILNGNHYHIASCYLLDKEIRAMSRQEAEQKGYTACRYCGAQYIEQVVVTEGGTRYHVPSCYHVGGASERITWEEIQRMGYLPCSICIGGGEWFG